MAIFARRLGVSLCLVALTAQGLLPVLHSGHVAEEEARHVYADASFRTGAPRLDAPSAPTHEHHDPASCPVCPAASRSRLQASANGRAGALEAPAVALRPKDVFSFSRDAERPDAPPRGPPSA